MKHLKDLMDDSQKAREGYTKCTAHGCDGWIAPKRVLEGQKETLEDAARREEFLKPARDKELAAIEQRKRYLESELYEKPVPQRIEGILPVRGDKK